MKTRILMVCMGNICRSPLAEGILQFKLDPKKYEVDSAGMEAYHVGELPDDRSIKVAKENLLDITDQRARLFTLEDFEAFDIIYAMDRLVYDKLVHKAPDEEAASKVQFILNEVFPGENMEVPDPYYDSIYAFRNVYHMLDEAGEVIKKKLEGDVS